jgi:hypothetical protein
VNKQRYSEDGEIFMRSNTAIKTSRQLISGTIALAGIVFLVMSCSQVVAQQSPKTFASAAQASQALYDAVKSKDEAAVRAVLGCGRELVSAGDDAEDKLNRERFVQKYDEMHRLVREPDKTTVLYIGAENWPFPIPLVSRAHKWHFDSDAGSQEVLAREIGRNEITAIQVGKAFEDASRAEVKAGSDQDPLRNFAATLASGEDASSADRQPFDGYYFRRIAGDAAGVQLVAFPADYRSSGVMTFVITGDGSIFEKDLGPQTSTLAKQLQGKPAKDWTPVQSSESEIAGGADTAIKK